MAEASRIGDQIILMVRLGRVEVAQRLDQDRRAGGLPIDQLLQRGDIHGLLRRVREEHAGAVLPPTVLALTVHRERVNDLQEQQRERSQRHLRWVEHNFHGLRGVGDARTHLLIGG